MFVQPRHDLNEIAGPRAIVELACENSVPAVATGARRTRQTEDESGARHTCRRAALDRRGADLGVAQHMKGDGKAIHSLFKQWLDRFRRHVATGEASAAGGNDSIDASVGNPA